MSKFERIKEWINNCEMEPKRRSDLQWLIRNSEILLDIRNYFDSWFGIANLEAGIYTIGEDDWYGWDYRDQIDIRFKKGF